MIIGIIDSGIGGLTVLKEIDRKFKGNTLCYYADVEGFPYGEKDKVYLEDRLFSIAQKLLNENKIELLILGCNTATTNTLDFLKEKLSIPVLGVAPNIPLAYVGKVVVVATPSTVKAIKNNYLGSDIIFLEEKTLASEIEENYCDFKKIAKKLSIKISKYNAEILVLGCTHYVLLLPFLKIFYKNIVILSSIDILIDKLRLYVKNCHNSQNNLIDFLIPNDYMDKYLNIFENF